MNRPFFFALCIVMLSSFGCGDSAGSASDTPSWRMVFGGPFLAGTYSGTESQITLAPGGDALLQLGTGPTDSAVAVIVVAEADGPIATGTNMYPLPFNGVASDSTITFVDPSMVLPDSFMLDVINGDGMSTIMEPGGATFTHPAPATLTLIDYVAADPFVRGTIEGTYFTCYGPAGPGSEGDCDAYTVEIDFTATNTTRR